MPDPSATHPGPTSKLSVLLTTTTNKKIDVLFNYHINVADQWNVYWDMVVKSKGSTAASCCRQSIADFPSMNTWFSGFQNNTYRIHVQVMDKTLNRGPHYSTGVCVGGSTGNPPIARCSSSVLEGMVPLDVTIDMSDSYDEDGSLASSPFCSTCIDGVEMCSMDAGCCSDVQFHISWGLSSQTVFTSQ